MADSQPMTSTRQEVPRHDDGVEGRKPTALGPAGPAGTACVEVVMGERWSEHDALWPSSAWLRQRSQTAACRLIRLGVADQLLLGLNACRAAKAIATDHRHAVLAGGPTPSVTEPTNQ